MYTLYWSPCTSSMAPHAVLEEVGTAFDLRLVDFSSKAQQDPEYLKLNPNGRVPTLVVDGRHVIFESAAICQLLADRHPEAKLAPATNEISRGQYYQWLAYLSNTLQAAMFIFYNPQRFTVDAAGAEGIKKKSIEDIASIWSRIDRHLGQEGPYLLGDRFSAADIYCFMCSLWQHCCPDTYERFPNVKRLADLVRARPGVARMLKQNNL